MFEKHKLNYGICRDWTVTTSIDISARLNLARQPDDNINDCGVIISLYAWAVLTVIAWPHSPRIERGARGQIRNMRVCIDSMIV